MSQLPIADWFFTGNAAFNTLLSSSTVPSFLTAHLPSAKSLIVNFAIIFDF